MATASYRRRGAAQFGSAHRSGLPKIAASKAMRDFWEEEPPNAKASIALPGDARIKPSAATKGPRGRKTTEHNLIIANRGESAVWQRRIFRGVAQFGSAHRSGFPKIAASKAMRDFWEEEPPNAKASIALPGDARIKPSAATKGPRGRKTTEHNLIVANRGVAQFGSALG